MSVLATKSLDLNALPLAEMLRLARRLFWWESPPCALADPLRFVAQVMNLGTWEDICAVRGTLGESAFARVLDSPPAGVFTPRRWNYWHVRLGRRPTPPLPKRLGS